jgi:hypothetical protein
MTSPSPLQPSSPRVNRANWLGRYLGVEQDFDDKLKGVLTEALSSVQDAFGDLRDDNISTKAKRQQFSLAGKTIRGVIGDIFGRTENLVKDHRQDAAMAAVDAELYDNRGFLARIFKDPTERSQYADSLRATAARNIDATLTRVFETEKPLSARVYDSRRLADGSVSRAINNALARGDSARDLAKNVEHMIDPATPGGISYAARRLGRTEINNAFHGQSIHDAQESPWTQAMQWNLSKTHVIPDECEEYAAIKEFDVNHVPEKPHPNCRCYVTPVSQDYQSFEDDLVNGKYDDYLDQVLGVDAAENRSAQEGFAAGSSKFHDEVAKAKQTGKDIYPWAGISPDDRKLVQKFNLDRQTAPEPEQTVEERLAASKKKLKDAKVPKSIQEAKNAAQVGNWLRANYDGLEVVNFDYAAIDTRAAQEIAEGFVDHQAKFPKVNLRRLIVKPIVKYGDPLTVNASTNEIDNRTATEIVFNLNALAKYDWYKKEQKRLIESGWFSDRKGGEKPWRSTLIHEFGHVIDFSAGRESIGLNLDPAPYRGKRKAGDALIPVWDPDGTKWDGTPKAIRQYEGWVKVNAPSDYSLDQKDASRIQPDEYIAEMYSNFMETEPDRQVPAAKAIVQLMHRKLRESKRDPFVKRKTK